MNANAATVVVESILKGIVDVLDAMLSLTFKYEPGEPAELDEGTASELLVEFPVVIKSVVQHGVGQVALLFPVENALRLIALSKEQEFESKSRLDNSDIEVLTEVAEPALGSGVTNCMERFGHEIEQLESVEVSMESPKSAADFVSFLGANPVCCSFSYDAGPEFSGSAVIVYGGALEGLVPGNLAPAAKKASGSFVAEATLSSAEMSDILSGFGPEHGAVPSEMPAPVTSMNLNRVLDIPLLATVRLGRIEMPIAEILSLGPGSIIEVGHLIEDPVELLVNDKLIARGDVVVVDEKFGLRITEILSPVERIESLR